MENITQPGIMQNITQPGWHDLPDYVYHADPLELPGLSASTAKVLIAKSPMHAWHGHAKNPDAEPRKPNAAMNMGSAVHSIAFGGANIVAVEANDWRTKAAQQTRDLALSVGKIPVLEKQLQNLEIMGGRVKQRFEELYEGEYQPEISGFWKCPRSGILRRCRMDSKASDIPVIVDLKTTEASVDEASCIKRIYSENMHIQEAAYRECLETLEPQHEGRARFFFVFIEQKAPFALSRPIELTDGGQQLGKEQWAYAGEVWDECVKRGEYPGYTKQPIDAIPPSWTLNEWSARQNTAELEFSGDPA